MTITTLVDFNLSPKLILGTEEHRQLLALAAGRPDDDDPLLIELERASVVPDDNVPRDVVRMYSRVLYRTLGGEEQSVTLVYPAEADISAEKISVLTPVGTALIGLRTGDSITWSTRGRRKQMLTVLSVEPPAAAAAGDDPGPAAA